jgi:hypothetical protein
MFKIYVIEDCNGLKYVGRTTQNLQRRLSSHKSEKKRNRYRSCMTKLLDLDDCEIKCIDVADSKEESDELEKFWINSIDCVNYYKYDFDHKEWSHNYYQKNKEKRKEYTKKYRKENKEKVNKANREYRAKKKLLGSS